MKFVACFALALVIFGNSVAGAHEIGTTRVTVNFVQGTSYQIDVVTDAMSLAEKLTGQAPPSGESTAILQKQLQGYDALFRQRLNVAFDGAAVTPAIEYAVSGVVTATSSPEATIRMHGTIPHNAREFTWTYSWTFATYSLTVGDAATQWLEGGQTSAPVSLTLRNAPINRITTALRYLSLGFTHIVPNGFDHMLFVLGIFLLSRRLRQVLAQVSAFTIAHSITLGLSMYGLVSVSPKIVEPMIAVSIAYVAIENIFLSTLKPWRVALVFAFGLLHGMGFAGALKELGLPRSEFITALLSFNLGVEAGQLAVIGTAFLLVGWYCGKREWYRPLVVLPASMLIACTALYWTAQRVFQP
jgi:hydrogenase/urease accessory protein HupE